MRKLYSCIYLLLVSIILLSCGQDTRVRSKIPPVPFQTDSIQNASALEALMGAIRSNPSVAENYYKRAVVFHRMGELKRALDDINRADKLKQNTGKYMYLKALILRDQGAISDAFRAAQTAEILNIETPELYLLLGDLYQREKDYLMSKRYIAKALEISPKEGEAFYYLGTLAARRGDTATAIVQMNQAIRLKPSLQVAYFTLPHILSNRNLYDSALVINRKGLKYFPKNPDLYVARGQIFSKINGLDSAMKSFEKAFNLDEERVELLTNSAEIYRKRKYYTKALQYYQKVLDAKPELKRIRYSMALIYEEMKAFTKAEEYLKEEVKENPDDTEVIMALNRVASRLNSLSNIGPVREMLPVPVPTKRKITSPSNSRRKVSVVQDEQPKRDTARVRVQIIAPKRRINLNIDSTRRLKF